jgi:hypothetical protein
MVSSVPMCGPQVWQREGNCPLFISLFVVEWQSSWYLNNEVSRILPHHNIKGDRTLGLPKLPISKLPHDRAGKKKPYRALPIDSARTAHLRAPKGTLIGKLTPRSCAPPQNLRKRIAIYALCAPNEPNTKWEK